MARLQILELPMVDRGDDGMGTPFALVIDQAGEATRETLDPDAEGQTTPLGTTMQNLSASLAERLGARAILVFEETIDIPANWATVEGTDAGVVRLTIEPDLDGFMSQVEATIAHASRRLGHALKVTQQAADGTTPEPGGE